MVINRKLLVSNNKINLVAEDFDESINTNDVTIKVAASGLNRADLLQAQGLYQLDEGDCLGLELSGYNIETSEPICALVSANAHSDYIQVDQNLILPVPKGIDLISVAGLPETLITCWLNLFELGKLKSGESVLIHGGSSGIGSMAIQIAKCFDAKVFTTVGSEAKKQTCITLGADYVFNYQAEDYVTSIKSLGVCDLVLDILGGDEVNKNIAVLNKYGRIVMIAVMKGAKAQVNLGGLLMKNITITGSTLRSKTIAEKKHLIDSVVKNLYPLLESGKIKPIIDSIYNVADYEKAYARLENREHFGKIILTR